MKARCDRPTHPSYHNYGGRGITYELEWKLYVNFLHDMGESPQGLTLERTDNEKGYSKANCVWATYAEQNCNCRIQSRNISGVKGVTWDQRRSRWVARGKLEGKDLYLYQGPDLAAAKNARQVWVNGNL